MNAPSAQLAFAAVALAAIGGFLVGHGVERGIAFKIGAAALFCLSLFLFYCAAFTE